MPTPGRQATLSTLLRICHLYLSLPNLPRLAGTSKDEDVWMLVESLKNHSAGIVKNQHTMDILLRIMARPYSYKSLAAIDEKQTHKNWLSRQRINRTVLLHAVNQR